MSDELDAVFAECSQRDWDGYGANAVRTETYHHAKELLESLPASFPQPSLGAEPDGHITLDWTLTQRFTISVSVSPEGQLHYAALVGGNSHSGTVSVSEWKAFGQGVRGRQRTLMQGIDLYQAEQHLRRYAEQQGEDLDELIRKASRHFTGSGPLKARQEPATDAEIEMLVEDDMRAFP